MPTLEQFRQLRAGVPLETQSELITLMSQNPQLMFERIVELAAEKGMTTSVEEVKGFLAQMDEEEEFDDIEQDAVALSAIAGGARGEGGPC